MDIWCDGGINDIFWCDNAIVMMFKNIYLLDIQTEEFIDEMTRSNKNVLFWLVTGTMKKG